MAIKKKLILLSLIVSNILKQPTPEITIEQGILRGVVSENGEFYEYLGIPYATANASNRFQDPFPPPKWDRVFEAINQNSMCPQIYMYDFIAVGHEDCLKINVFAPIYATPSIPLPVMVFIHGGGFTEGSGNRIIYGPEYFVRHGVVLVTLNYRVGALGFLCLGIREAPGNAGLKDQQAALHWVSKNIRAFGGDPNSVTIFGESAGAASVSYHNLNIKSKGLFKKAIMQSGSSLGPWALADDPIGAASKLASGLGYNTNDPQELLKIFKKATHKELVDMVHEVAGNSIFDKFMFVPCVEKNIPGVEHVLTESPYTILKSGIFNKVSTINGFNNKEGILFAAKETDIALKEFDGQGVIPKNFKFDSDDDRRTVTEQIRKYYFNTDAINKTTVLKLADLYGDVHFIIPSLYEAFTYSQISDQAQYNYVFKYKGKRNLMKYIVGFANEPGATHADELFYMFKSIIPFPTSKEDIIITDTLTTMWTNFAKFGSPIITNSQLLHIDWIPSNTDTLKFLAIDNKILLEEMPSKEAFKFWDQMYTRFRRKIYN